MRRAAAMLCASALVLGGLAGCDNEVRASTEEAAAKPANGPTEVTETPLDADADAASPEGDTTPGDTPGDDAPDPFALEAHDPGQRPMEVTNAERDVMERIAHRSRTLDERELSLAARSQSANTLETELQSRLDRISELEKRLQDQVGVGEVARQRRDARITALADLVASMTPQAGSDMVASLSDEDAQWILLAIARKSQRKAAKLMALMPTERAAQLGQLYLDLDPKAVPKGEVLSPLGDAAAPDGAAKPPSARTDAPRPAPEEVTAP